MIHRREFPGAQRIRIDSNCGHGASSLSKALGEAADIHSFLLFNLGVSPKKTWIPTYLAPISTSTALVRLGRFPLKGVAMKVFLTSADITDLASPIECEVVSGWEGWNKSYEMLAKITPHFKVNRYGISLEITRLILCRIEGTNLPSDFLKDHAWVDVFVPSRSSAGHEQPDWRLCVGLMHRTLGAAHRYRAALPTEERN